MRQNGVRSNVRFPYSSGMKKGGRVKKFGRPHMTKVISEQGVKKGFPGLTKDAGDLYRSKKALEKKAGKKFEDIGKK